MRTTGVAPTDVRNVRGAPRRGEPAITPRPARGEGSGAGSGVQTPVRASLTLHGIPE
jgi:hypothetical protein